MPSPIQSILSGPSYDVNAEIARLRSIHDSYPLKGEDATHKHTLIVLKRTVESQKRHPAEHCLELLYGAITLLYEAEGLYDPPFLYRENHEKPPTFFKASLEKLERLMRPAYRAAFEKSLVEFLSLYLTHAPPGCFIEEEETDTRILLCDAIDARVWVSILLQHGLQLFQHSPLFPKTREQLIENLHTASGKVYDPSDPSDKLVFPDDSDFTGEQLVRSYLRDTPLHALLAGTIPFAIPQNTRFSGQWVLAPPNRGKTNMLLHQIERDLEEEASILVMDSKGDLINPLKTLRSIKDRLVILEPSLECPLAINPLDLGATTTHAVSFIEYVFSSLLESEPTPLQNTLFRAVLILLREVPNATFADFRKILTAGWRDYEPHLSKLDPEDQEFFANGEFDSRTYEPTKTQLLWRIRDLTTRIPLLRAMFRSPKTRINMGELMDSPGRVVILDVRKQLLGDQGAEFLGRLYIALVRAAADQRQGRRPEEKLPCYFYIDEAHTIISNDTKLAGIIQECRSQRVAMILAHQAISQISNQVTLGALSDCAIRMANSDDETAQLAPRLRTTPDVLKNLPIGSFAAFVRDTTKQAVTLRIPLSTVPSAPRMTQEEQTALMARMRANYAFDSRPPAPSLGDALKAFAATAPPPSATAPTREPPPSPSASQEEDKW